eukprot:4486822-Prymnesium_polylepis.1
MSVSGAELRVEPGIAWADPRTRPALPFRKPVELRRFARLGTGSSPTSSHIDSEPWATAGCALAVGPAGGRLAPPSSGRDEPQPGRVS